MMMSNYSIIRDFRLITEAYHQIYEDVEGRNINRAEKYIKKNHTELLNRKTSDGRLVTPRLITQELRNMMPNSRLEKCKFLEGVARIYLDELRKFGGGSQRKIGLLNQYLGILSAKENVLKYDNNLNGMSFADIERICSSVLKANLDNDRKELSIGKFVSRNDLRIVRIRNYLEASEYGRYVDWCVCHDERMYENYTNGNSDVFYFIMKGGFENCERIMGNGCPFDEYGLSMVAVSVNGDGTLNTCTTRWNHENGGTDYMMTTEQISQLVGRNFYTVFKPRSVDELWESWMDDVVEQDEIARKLGAMKVHAKGDHVKYIIRGKDGIFELPVVKYDKNGGLTCIADKMLHWYDANGDEVFPPKEFDGDIVIHNIDTLESLRGLPRVLNGNLVLSELDGITSLDGIPEKISGKISILKCSKINDIGNIGRKCRKYHIYGCPNIRLAA